MPNQPTAQTRENEGWLPALIFAVYLLISWVPGDYLPFGVTRWYVFLFMAGFLFLLNRQRLDTGKSAVLWMVLGLQFIGAVLAILRAVNPDQALWNAVGFGGNVLGLILLVPLAARPITRKMALFVLVITAILWSIEIQRLINNYGYLTYSSFGKNLEGNKNAVGFLLTMAGLVVFYLSLFWKPKKLLGKGSLLVLRVILAILGGVFIFNMTLIYSRAGLVTASVGLGFILIQLYLSSPKGQRLFRVLLVAGSIGLAVVVLIPLVGKLAPQWSNVFDRLTSQGIESFPTRLLLLHKGWYLIQQNPLIGVGIGGSRLSFYTTSTSFHTASIHNLYLTEWAEKGILGLLGYLIWIVVFIRFSFKNFNQLSPPDQIWILLIFVLFVEMNFKDLNTLAFIMLLLFAGMMHPADPPRGPDR